MDDAQARGVCPDGTNVPGAGMRRRAVSLALDGHDGPLRDLRALGGARIVSIIEDMSPRVCDALRTRIREAAWFSVIFVGGLLAVDVSITDAVKGGRS